MSDKDKDKSREEKAQKKAAELAQAGKKEDKPIVLKPCGCLHCKAGRAHQ